MVTYSLEELVSLRCVDRWTWKKDYAEVLLCGSGESVDAWNGEDWEEIDFLYTEMDPFIDDDELDLGNEPRRTHGYSSTYRLLELNFTEPESVEEEQVPYTIAEIRSRIISDECVGDDEPGNGFDYHNIPEEWDEEEDHPYND